MTFSTLFTEFLSMATEMGFEQSGDVGRKLPIAILRHDGVRWRGANSAWRTGIHRACQSALGFAFVAEAGSLEASKNRAMSRPPRRGTEEVA